jgi:hypothetical protein
MFPAIKSGTSPCPERQDSTLLRKATQKWPVSTRMIPETTKNSHKKAPRKNFPVENSNGCGAAPRKPRLHPARRDFVRLRKVPQGYANDCGAPLRLAWGETAPRRAGLRETTQGYASQIFLPPIRGKLWTRRFIIADYRFRILKTEGGRQIKIRNTKLEIRNKYELTKKANPKQRDEKSKRI